MEKIIVNDIQLTAINFVPHSNLDLKHISLVIIGEYRPTDNKMVVTYQGATYSGFKDLMHYDPKSNTTRFVLHWE